MHLINVRPEALDELKRAWGWHEDQRPGLEDEFRACVDAAMAAAARNPLAWPRVGREVRRVLVRRFPYSVLYVAQLDRIDVLAVFHGARAPREWKRRL